MDCGVVVVRVCMRVCVRWDFGICEEHLNDGMRDIQAKAKTPRAKAGSQQPATSSKEEIELVDP